MGPLVSVIVPVYNVEDYLVRCLDSLCRQSLLDIEILLIDDASPDKSGHICDMYALKDPRLTVFHNKKNQGLAIARNIGIVHANSKYIMFVDSDDWVHEDFCKEAYECAVHYQADLVMFRYEHIGYPKKNSHKIPCDALTSSGYKTQLEAIDLLQKGVGQTAWNKLYRKDLFNGIIFPAGYYYEDLGTIYKTVLHASRIYYLDKILYNRCYRSGSISTLKTNKSLQDKSKMFLQQYHDLIAWGYPQEKLEFRLKNNAMSYCIYKNTNYSDPYYVFYANVLLKSKKIPRQFTCKRKVLFVLYASCPLLFELICSIFNKKIR